MKLTAQLLTICKCYFKVSYQSIFFKSRKPKIEVSPESFNSLNPNQSLNEFHLKIRIENCFLLKVNGAKIPIENRLANLTINIPNNGNSIKLVGKGLFGNNVVQLKNKIGRIVTEEINISRRTIQLPGIVKAPSVVLNSDIIPQTNFRLSNNHFDIHQNDFRYSEIGKLNIKRQTLNFTNKLEHELEQNLLKNEQ